MGQPKRNCELCDAQATIHCPCDSAYLCRSCDRKVHSANFLVARHLRSSLCSICGDLDGNRFSGAEISFPARNLCSSCLPENLAGDGEIHSISSSSCVSSSTDISDEASSSSSTRREKIGGGAPAAVDSKVEGILVNWCRKMAVDERRVVRTAMGLLADCVSQMAILPFRVFLTTSFWVALRISSGGSSCRDLRRLEHISGVPAKLVLATESRLARVLKRRKSRDDHVEGSAEC